MPSRKLSRTNEDIRLAMSELLRDVKDPRLHQGLVSVTAVETTGDLKYCKIYLSVLGLESEKDFLQGLKSASGWLRRELGRKVQLRNVPELQFCMDRSIEEGAHINDLISHLTDVRDDAERTDEAQAEERAAEGEDEQDDDHDNP